MLVIKLSATLLLLTSQQTPSSGIFQAQMCGVLPIYQSLEEGLALIVSLGLGWKLTGSLHPQTDLNMKGPV